MTQPNIIIISHDTILRIAIRKILYDAFELLPQECGLTEDYALDSLANYDLIITDTTSFIENIETFLPQRLKTVIISAENSNNNESSVISRFCDESTIIDKFNSIIHKLEKKDINQNTLSQREIEVLKLIVTGCINKEIADILHISINTVLSHRKNITSKLGIKSVSGLSVYAMMNGYISLK